MPHPWRCLGCSRLDALFNAFGNATEVPPANWRDEPSTRGTWNILSTCLITLGLCLWTALHLNIPRHKEGAWYPKIRKTAWLMLGLLAPEMLAYTAWYQHRAAHRLDAVIRRKLGQPQRVGPSHAHRVSAFFARCWCCHKSGGGSEKRKAKGDDHETKDVESDASGIRRHRWTTAHSFYVIMGGLVFDTGDADINFLPASRQRVTLTPRGLVYLLEHEPDLIPDLSEEQICDKSKASSLAKSLVCLQALWFCVQCIVRLGQGLAVSLLELNVFGHAICAALMYFLWWDKPLDIEEPTVLSGNMVREMCALMCMRSFPGSSAISNMRLTELPHGVTYGTDRRHNVAEISVKTGEDDAKIKWYRLDKMFASSDFYDDIMVVLGRKPPRQLHEYDQPIEPTILECRLEWTATGSVEDLSKGFCRYISYPVDLKYPGSLIRPRGRKTSPSLPSAAGVAAGKILHAKNTGTQSIQSPPLGAYITSNCIDGLSLTLGRWPRNEDGIIKAEVFLPRRPQPDYAPVFVTPSEADVLRWRFCARALQRYCPQPRWISVSAAPSHQDFPAYRSVYERSPNWPSSQHLDFTNEKTGQVMAILLGLTFAGLLYGGLHLLAWNAPFPSEVEDKLWRSSGILLASSGFFVIILILATILFTVGYEWVVRTSFWQDLKTRLGHRYRPLANIVNKVGTSAIAFILLAFAGVYIAARGFLVVESFLQLVHLPDSAYTLPGWSQYFPHIT